ncbi:MAG: hypothetical protein KatS3mg042_1095 [Rhodothermaceae bacterium]|nr:MAG: hypothetical protein KatS3mg042_1095 [Rhodothermaceae bacterium]
MKPVLVLALAAWAVLTPVLTGSPDVHAQPAPEGRAATAPTCIYRAEPRVAGYARKAALPATRPRTATFDVRFIDENPSDPWPEEARAALLYALDLWASFIVSPVPITIEATWADLGSCTAGAFTLAQAGPTTLWRNVRQAPFPDTWYPAPLAEALHGADLNNGEPDLAAAFNRRCGPSGQNRWHFDPNRTPLPDRLDFVTVALHELAHGLGFLGSAAVDDGRDGNGTECDGTDGHGCLGFDDGTPAIFDRFPEDGFGTRLVALPSPSVTLGEALTGRRAGLFFGGPLVVSAYGDLPPPLYAPARFDAGSSYAHLDEQTFNDTPDALMTPSLAQAEVLHHPGEVTCGLMADLGWTVTAACSPRAGKPPPPDRTFTLSDVFPNPFTGAARLLLTPGDSEPLTVDVYDALGRRVARLYAGPLTPGLPRLFTLDGTRLAAGVYFIRVSGPTFTATRTAVRR